MENKKRASVEEGGAERGAWNAGREALEEMR